MHDGHLGISLSSVTRSMALSRPTTLDDHNVGNHMTGTFVQSSVDLPHIVLLLAFSKRKETETLWVEIGVDSKDVQNNSGGASIVSCSDNVSIADDGDKLSLVVVLELGKRVDRLSKGRFALCVTRDLADDELVLGFRRSS